jgi:hypothetical protein
MSGWNRDHDRKSPSTVAMKLDSQKLPSVRIGADVGGTFTDVVLINQHGAIVHRKLPSTGPDFERAVLSAIRDLLRSASLDGQDVGTVAHGTTVATNAVLEQRGARTALVTTAGFRDVLELRRIRAPRLYDLFFQKPPPLVPRYLRLEVTERIAADGQCQLTAGLRSGVDRRVPAAFVFASAARTNGRRFPARAPDGCSDFRLARGPEGAT